jgi:hypothetical protein
MQCCQLGSCSLRVYAREGRTKSSAMMLSGGACETNACWALSDPGLSVQVCGRLSACPAMGKAIVALWMLACWRSVSISASCSGEVCVILLCRMLTVRSVTTPLGQQYRQVCNSRLCGGGRLRH